MSAQPEAEPAGPRILADGWYSWVIPRFSPVTEIFERWPQPLPRLVWRHGWLRAAVLVSASVRCDVLVVIRADPGWRSVLLARALFGRRRKLVALHYIDHQPRAGWPGRGIDLAWRPVERWAARRALIAVQVLSPGEVERCAERLELDPARLALIPFAWRMSARGLPGPIRGSGLARGSGFVGGGEGEPRVVAIGRAQCDWPTLFEAAADGGWALTVVCGEADRRQVEALNRDGTARVLCEIPHQAARALLREAAICVICMRDAEVSHGQVRLCDAVEAGAAVVASRTRSLEGYVEDARTAVLVAPGDPRGLRDGVQALLADAPRRERLAVAAFERAEAWTWDDYLKAIESLVVGAARPGSGLARDPRP